MKSTNKIVCYQADNEWDEARFICETIYHEISEGRHPDDIAVLYRLHVYTYPIENAFFNWCLPYRNASVLKPGNKDDDFAGSSIGTVTLLRLQETQGREFSVVFIAGLEEGSLPHSRSIDSPFTLEEERRLFQMGLTRAKERLILSYAKERNLYGYIQESSISRFVDEIPRDSINFYNKSQPM